MRKRQSTTNDQLITDENRARPRQEMRIHDGKEWGQAHQQGSCTTPLPIQGSRPTPLLCCSVSPYFLLLEADLVGFLAGFAFALAITMSPSFTYTPGFHAKV